MSVLFAFLLHLTAFSLVAALAVGALSTRPTRVFLGWRKPLAEGRLPAVATATLLRLRALVQWELAGAVLILLCAALMARGVGSF